MTLVKLEYENWLLFRWNEDLNRDKEEKTKIWVWERDLKREK